MHIAVKAQRPESAKELYPYQKEAIDKILSALESNNNNDNILFQLPTGGGKTVIFSEVVRQYIFKKKERVLILTHRIELLRQTATTLNETGVPTKLITSEIKELEEKDEYVCFLAMVETLNNRLQEDETFVSDINLVIVDEAHYNSFKKIFKYFSNSTIFGVTATPLSSNINTPLNQFYNKLIVGDAISELIKKNYLSNATTFTFDVKLKSLKIGSDGDYTINSLDKIYGDSEMQTKLLSCYEGKALGTKTLIFNSSIKTSVAVHDHFAKAGYDNIKHLDSNSEKNERREILRWFRETPGAILTSVGILTTGFDEPTVETIILNRATRSLTLYHQMIGRGSRKLPNKNHFNIIDLGDNARRLGLWQDYIDWREVFKNPNSFLEHLSKREEEIEKGLHYLMPDSVRNRFPNTPDENFNFDLKSIYDDYIFKGNASTGVIQESIENHYQRILENSNDYFEAIDLIEILQEEIEHRLSIYTNCLAKTTKNYFHWLLENYNNKLKSKLRAELPIPD